MKHSSWFLKSAIGLMAFAAMALAQDQSEPKRDASPMTDDQRAQMEQRLDDAWAKLPVREKMIVMRLHGALKQMPPEERKFIHDRVERFIDMAPEERERIKQNYEKWKNMTAEEKQQAREKFRERRKQFEEKWRAEHPGEEPPPFPFRHQKPEPKSDQ